MKNLKVIALLQASGVAGYCLLISLLLWKGNEIFGKVPNFFGPVAFLVLFIVSGFYKAYKLFFDDKKKQAIELVIYTTGWLFLFFVFFLAFAVLTK